VHLVEDGQEVVAVARELLTGSGYEVRAYPGPEEFLAQVEPRSPQCLVLELRLPRMSGLEVQRQLLAKDVEIPIVMMSASGSIRAAVQALKLGAEDFLEKPVDPDVLLDAISRAIARDTLRAEQRGRVREAQDLLGRLSPRERDVFDLLVQGHASKSIAAELGLSKKTIDLHRARVMKKLAASSLTDLARLAQQHGTSLGPPGPLPRQRRP